MSDDYPPAIVELLAIPHPVSLGPGSPNREAGERLQKLDAARLFGPAVIRNQDMAMACLAGLWLRFDFLDESHTISQGIDVPAGRFWHAIMHRREGDFGNSKYWWRRVGAHPGLIGDPFEFVDAVEEFVTHGRGDANSLQTTQDREWQILFDFCFRNAMDG